MIVGRRADCGVGAGRELGLHLAQAGAGDAALAADRRRRDYPGEGDLIGRLEMAVDDRKDSIKEGNVSDAARRGGLY
ncbi:hypothetical protein HNQ77_002653 [Silvibacterium bohemicum]|uniref:Uncharacterized protein n=1 Tax=Silvibacterium bohemicum TaxID=1577686 RepID=A0A841JW67_9BACT|nr:hypothetical protein [Silvibacterium bohemicum]MBB6144697.1 hypothetical protein [Silvibacterium bohemicum]